MCSLISAWLKNTFGCVCVCVYACALKNLSVAWELSFPTYFRISFFLSFFFSFIDVTDRALCKFTVYSIMTYNVVK